MRDCDVCGKITHGYFDVEVGHLCDTCMEEFLERTEFFFDDEMEPMATQSHA